MTKTHFQPPARVSPSRRSSSRLLANVVFPALCVACGLLLGIFLKELWDRNTPSKRTDLNLAEQTATSSKETTRTEATLTPTLLLASTQRKEPIEELAPPSSQDSPDFEYRITGLSEIPLPAEYPYQECLVGHRFQRDAVPFIGYLWGFREREYTQAKFLNNWDLVSARRVPWDQAPEEVRRLLG